MNSTLRHLAAVVFALVALTAHAAQAAEPNRNLTVAAAEKRVALVIGNSDYKSSPLVNPVNDARAIAAKLRSLGFTVQLKENLKAREIGGVYREFRNLVTPGSVALVFYAGHGVQFKGQNYFPAVDSDISGEEDVPLQSLNLGTLLDNMEEAKAGVSLVLLDACRDNPFARRFRSASRGLAKVEAASGTLIHYATKPGSVASDGDGRNGTYTEALLAQMDATGVPIELMLKQVTNQVVGKTQGKQEPWIEGSLRGNFFFKPDDGRQVAQLGPGLGGHSRTPEQIEDELWDAIRNDDKPRVFEAYLKGYPNGRYVTQAKVKLAGIKGDVKPVAPPEPAIASRDDVETLFWNEAKASNSKDYYNAYVREYPKGKYMALAKLEIKKLVDQEKPERAREAVEQRKAAEQQRAEKEQAEQNTWEDAMRGKSVATYTRYLDTYAKGRYSALAQVAKQKAQQDEADKEKQAAKRVLSDLAAFIEASRESGLPSFKAVSGLPILYSKAVVNLKAKATDLQITAFFNAYRRDAEAGDTVSQCSLGNMYANGLGVAKDETEAVKWYRKSADQGLSAGQVNLGVMYEKGLGVAKDETEALKWFRNSADQGFSGGQASLGFMYENGLGVAKDVTEAVKWYRKSADQGNAFAKVNLKNLGQ